MVNDPNWLLAWMALATILGGFIVWLSVTFADIRFIKRETIKNGNAIHKMRNLFGPLYIRMALVEQKLGLKNPSIEDDSDD